MGIRHSCDVFHDDFRGLSFPSPRLATYHDARVLVLLTQLSIRRVGDRLDVGRVLEKLAALVFADELISIDVHDTVGIDGNRHLADVCVNFSCLISGMDH